jgi:hypothetical protein
MEKKHESKMWKEIKKKSERDEDWRREINCS